ncbi:MAG: hypothetical protein ABIS45_01080, partial [Burkholderiales bacterium]
ICCAIAALPALAADPSTRARAMFTESCLRLVTAMGLQGDMQKRFVDECVRAKENVNNKGVPGAPYELNAAC